MEKSNKLLLGGFLTVILLITTIHIALYAKYKNGHYTIYHRPDTRGDDRMQSFSNVLFVTIRNVDGATVQFSDKAQLEKGKEDIIGYVQKGDSLVITGRDYDGPRDGRRMVNLTLPLNVTLSAFNSILSFEKGMEAPEINPVIYLQNTNALFFDKENPLLLGHVKVIASNSSIAAFQGNTQVRHLEVQLSNSALEYNEGDAGQLTIVTDSLSRISLHSKQLLKAKITTTVSDNP